MNARKSRVAVLALAAGIVLGIGISTSASASGTASCTSTNTTSSLLHTLQSSSCNLVQARAERYYASGAHETVYGAQVATNSFVSVGSGVALSAYAGRGRPVSDHPWAGYLSMAAGTHTYTFTVNW